jgi:hypothetical protein
MGEPAAPHPADVIQAVRVEFTRPAGGEQYLVDKHAAERLVRVSLKDLELLSLQTRHRPKMTEGVPYCATYSSRFLRVLSVEESLTTPVFDPETKRSRPLGFDFDLETKRSRAPTMLFDRERDRA